MKTRYLVSSITVMALLAGGVWGARKMQGVPQNIGKADMDYSFLKETDCRNCHGTSLADRHHGTNPAKKGECVKCHTVQKAGDKLGVKLTRDCKTCHSSSWHHKTAAAKSAKCNTCHDVEGVDDFNPNNRPKYEITKVTPTIQSCRNCHQAATVGGKKLSSNQDTHHGTELEKCTLCHAPEGKQKDVGVRSCENCHSIKAIHAVGPHVEKGNCVGCHVLGAPKGTPPGQRPAVRRTRRGTKRPATRKPATRRPVRRY